MKYPEHWTIGNFIEELIMICEVLEVPGMKAKRDEVIDQIMERFTKKQREDAGLVF
jgi:hypothetical protein